MYLNPFFNHKIQNLQNHFPKPKLDYKYQQLQLSTIYYTLEEVVVNRFEYNFFEYLTFVKYVYSIHQRRSLLTDFNIIFFGICNFCKICLFYTLEEVVFNKFDYSKQKIIKYSTFLKIVFSFHQRWSVLTDFIVNYYIFNFCKNGFL